MWRSPLLRLLSVGWRVGCERREDRVVDQAHLADARGDRQQRRRASSCSSGSSVSGSTSARYSGSTSNGRIAARAASSSAAAERSPAAASASAASQRGGQRQRARALVARRAARCGWTSPGRRARARSASASIRTGRFRSRDEPADHDDLLGVLLAEVGDVGQRHAEQLGDDGGDAAEVLGAAGCALEPLGDAEHLDGRGEARAGRPPRPTARTARRRRPAAASSASRRSSRG